MNPEPAVEPKQSVFAVPAHISAVTFSDGCRQTHFPLNGAVDCPACAIASQGFFYPAAPAPEQPAADADVQPFPPAAVDASVPVASAPAPDAPAEAPARASKKPAADATSA